MNLQTTKPRARLVRDPEDGVFWRVRFSCGVQAFATDFRVALATAYRFKLARMVEGAAK